MKTIFFALLMFSLLSLSAKESAIPRIISAPDSVQWISITEPGDDYWVLSYSTSGYIAVSLNQGRFPFYFKTDEVILKGWISGIKVFIQTDKYLYRLKIETKMWKRVN